MGTCAKERKRGQLREHNEIKLVYKVEIKIDATNTRGMASLQRIVVQCGQEESGGERGQVSGKTLHPQARYGDTDIEEVYSMQCPIDTYTLFREY